MKKYLMLLLITISTQATFSQSKFSNGFINGFKEGYCHNQGIGCLSPNPPIAPIPNVNESINSYQDGYNRGFEQDLSAQKTNSNNTQTRVRYKTAEPNFVDDGIYKPNYDLMLKAVEHKQKQLRDTYEVRQQLFYDNVKNAYQSYFKKDYYRVIQYCQRALNSQFHNSEVYFLLGVAYYHTGDYSLSLSYLMKAKALGENNEELYTYIDSAKQQKLEDYKNFKIKKEVLFGIKAGASYNKNLTSPMLGAFLQIRKNNNFAGVVEINYFQSKESEGFLYVDGYKEPDKTKFVQVNFTLKNALTKRLELIYGIGSSFDVSGQSLIRFDANAGLQYFLNYKLFLEGKFNYHITDFSEESTINHTFPKYNIMFSLGYQF